MKFKGTVIKQSEVLPNFHLNSFIIYYHLTIKGAELFMIMKYIMEDIFQVVKLI